MEQRTPGDLESNRVVGVLFFNWLLVTQIAVETNHLPVALIPEGFPASHTWEHYGRDNMIHQQSAPSAVSIYSPGEDTNTAERILSFESFALPPPSRIIVIDSRLRI